MNHPIYRIKANWERSPVALQSHLGLDIIDIDPVRVDELDQSKRENGATAVHKKVMGIFLASNTPYCVVLEDDAIMLPVRNWLSYTEFDFFIPFAHNRVHLPQDDTIRIGKLPKYGAFAYLCSRQYALRYHALLEKGGLADVVSHAAAKGLTFGSYAGNAVNHDNEAPSMISEERRKDFLKKYPGQKPRSWFSRLFG
jgi:hypothetical protein